MASKHSIDHMATTIASLGKKEVKRKIRHFKGRFKLDFDEKYLDSLSVDRLRHILFAAVASKHRNH